MLETVLVFLATLLVMLWWRSRPQNRPPSPGLALPIVGHLHLFKGDPVEQIQAWRHKLGDIFTIQMGSYRFVVLSGYDMITEACMKHQDKMMDRPDNFLHREVFDYAGVVSLSGERWREQRAFLQSTLRELGLGKNIMAERIRIEVDSLLDGIEKTKGEATDICHLVNVCVSNVISSVTFGKRFERNDQHITTWISNMKLLFKLLGASAAVNFFPFLQYYPGDRFRFKQLQSTVETMRATLRKWLDKHNRTINVSDEAFEDVVQAYFTEMERKISEGVSTTSLDEKNLLSSAMSLFNAGTETTANTIVFAVLYLINYPEIQEQLFQEIKTVVGTDRAPQLADKPKLRYLSAFLMETQRAAGVVPQGIDRLTTDDFLLGGYTVDKGTCVLLNLESLYRDKNVWGDPQNFRPERFLADDGSVVVKKELLPFGVGKRNCLGEGLAVMELYLFIAALIQKFEFFPEDKDQLPTMVPLLGFTRAAQPFKPRAFNRRV